MKTLLQEQKYRLARLVNVLIFVKDMEKYRIFQLEAEIKLALEKDPAGAQLKNWIDDALERFGIEDFDRESSNG